MAARGTFFEPNIGLVSQNYIENRPRYLGIGNYDEAGFKFTEDGIPLKLSMGLLPIEWVIFRNFGRDGGV